MTEAHEGLEPDTSSPDPSNPWGLSARDRQLLVLRSKGLSYGQVAAVVGKKEQTLKNQGSALIARLQKAGIIDLEINNIFDLVTTFRQAHPGWVSDSDGSFADSE